MFMLGMETEIEIDSVIGAVTGLSEGIPLKRESALRATPLYKVALKRFGAFLQVRVNELGGVGQLLVGTKAIENLIETQGYKLSSGAIHDIDSKAVRQLRVHDWLLTDEQRDIREEVIKAMTSNALAPLKALTAPLAINPGSPRPAAEGASASSAADGSMVSVKKEVAMTLSSVMKKFSASASQKLPQHKQKNKAAGKKNDLAEDSEDGSVSRKASLLNLFGPKSKSED